VRRPLSAADRHAPVSGGGALAATPFSSAGWPIAIPSGEAVDCIDLPVDTCDLFLLAGLRRGAFAGLRSGQQAEKRRDRAAYRKTQSRLWLLIAIT